MPLASVGERWLFTSLVRTRCGPHAHSKGNPMLEFGPTSAIDVSSPGDPHPAWCPLDSHAGGPSHGDAYICLGYVDDRGEVIKELEMIIPTAAAPTSAEGDVAGWQHLCAWDTEGRALAFYGINRRELLRRIEPALGATAGRLRGTLDMVDEVFLRRPS